MEQKGQALYLTFPSFTKTQAVEHLFSTRLGGVSEGIFSTMNLSYTRGDKKEAVDENYRRIADILGCKTEMFVCSDQTHTTNIRKVTEADCGKGVLVPKDYQDVDGLVTDREGIVLATFFCRLCAALFFGYIKACYRTGTFRLAWYGGTHWKEYDRYYGKGIRLRDTAYSCCHRSLHLRRLLRGVGGCGRAV